MSTTQFRVPVARTPRAWLEAFSSCVRAREYDSARELFDPSVTAFGTVARDIHGLDELVREQWQHVWEVTEGFDFLPESILIESLGDCAWSIALWQSFGRRPDGRRFPRQGRATYVLRRTDGGWVCVHSHHSFVPAV